MCVSRPNRNVSVFSKLEMSVRQYGWGRAAGWSCGSGGTANGGYADVVAAGEFVKRSTARAATGGFLLLRRNEGRGTPHLLPLGFGAAPALCRAGADKIALHVGQAAEYGKHQASGAGAGVGPLFRAAAVLRLL
jgi:hypothetical protein